jgi:6-phosphogluconolactonase
MDRLQVITFADAEAVSQAAAREFSRCATEAIVGQGKFTVALSGGSTPRRLYQILSDAPHRDAIDWSKIEIFWGDERSVAPDHADSNYRMASEAMLTRLPILPAHVHRMQAEREDRDAAAQEYQAEIAKTFGVDPAGEPPVFDLILLGMGPDAHTASLFPGSTALGETRKWVVPNWVEKFKTFRLTMTRPIINKARQVLFLVAGKDKAEPLKSVFCGPSDPSKYPSQLICPNTGLLTWYLDVAAVAEMTKGFNPSWSAS